MLLDFRIIHLQSWASVDGISLIIAKILSNIPEPSRQSVNLSYLNDKLNSIPVKL